MTHQKETTESRGRIVRLIRVVAALSLLSPGLPAVAMTPLSEDELVQVSGQDGLDTAYSVPALTLDSWSLLSDAGVSGKAGGAMATGATLYPYGGAASLDGTLTLDVGASSNADAGALAIVSHLGPFRLGGPYSGAPTAGDGGFNAKLAGDANRSFGQWALVSGASGLDFIIAGKPFYGSPSTTQLKLSLQDARLLYQQNWYYHANIVLDDIDFTWEMPAAIVDIDSDGLCLAGDATFSIDFDLLYKFHSDQNMSTVTANDRPLLQLGWAGSLLDTLVYLRPGGIWDTTTNQYTGATFSALPAGRSEGINIGLRWNYASDFIWRFGHASGDRELLQFGNWTSLEQATGPVSGRYGFDFPLIVLDALDVGDDTHAGGSLCWGSAMTNAACSGGGVLVNLRAGTVEGYNTDVNRSGGATAMQVIRNGSLYAWANSITVSANNGANEDTFPWGLIYTLGNIQSNVYLYPGGSESDTGGGSRNQGVLMDVLFTSQSFGDWESNFLTTSGGTCNAVNGTGCNNSTRWSHGTHFMLADMAKQQGVGLLGSSFLLASDDLRLWLKNTWDGQNAPENYDGGIDLFSPRTRASLKALIGGVRLPRGLDLVRAADIDYNFEGLWNFRLSPTPADFAGESGDFLAYSGAIRYRCGSTTAWGCLDNAFGASTGSAYASGSGSYMAFSEPGRPDVALKFADMSGDVAWTEGRIQLRARNDTCDPGADPTCGPAKSATAKPDLVIGNKLLVGKSAETRMGDAAAGSSLGSGGPAGRTFTSNVMFGNNHMLTWAIPAANMHASIVVMPQ